jgi:hypothetical protein
MEKRMSWELTEEFLLVPLGIALLALILIVGHRSSPNVAPMWLFRILAVITVVWLAWILLRWIS